MKNLSFIFLFYFTAFVATAKNSSDNRYPLSFPTLHSKYVQSSPQDYATEIIGRIISVLGLKPNFEVKAANVPNAAAVVYNQKRYVLYNPAFINALVKTAGNEWAAVSVLAHEIGHHLNGHTLENHGSRPDQELEADEFSGFVLRRMGASLEEAQVAMQVAANARTTDTHPAKHDRLTAIATGWKNADAQAGGDVNLAKIKTSPFTEEQVIAQRPTPPIANKYIAANVHFNADEDGEYYVTTRLNLVKVENNQLFIIGKLSPIDNKEYPFLIHDEATNLLVNAKGSIMNTKGNVVGYLSVSK
jgi:predicted HD phosphohydrolase